MADVLFASALEATSAASVGFILHSNCKHERAEGRCEHSVRQKRSVRSELGERGGGEDN